MHTNQQTIQSTHTGTLDIPQLPPEAAVAHTFTELQHNLIGVSPLTDAGCTVLFERDEATIQCPGASPVKCPSTGTGLWTITLQGFKKAATYLAKVALVVDRVVNHTSDQPFNAMVAIGNSNHPADLVAFHHTALWSPSISTVETAMDKGYLPPLPCLTKALLRKYHPDLEATTMGHLDSKRKNIQSTKTKGDWITVTGKKQKKHGATAMETIAGDTQCDAFPTHDPTRCNQVYLATTEPKQIDRLLRPNGTLPHSIQRGEPIPPHCICTITIVTASSCARSRTGTPKASPQPSQTSTRHSPKEAANQNSTAWTMSAHRK
jgi:hypothetical protein